MKTFRSALAFALSASLIVLSPGASAWSAVVEVSGLNASPAAGGSSLAGGAVHALSGAASGNSLSPSASSPRSSRSAW